MPASIVFPRLAGQRRQRRIARQAAAQYANGPPRKRPALTVAARPGPVRDGNETETNWKRNGNESGGV